MARIRLTGLGHMAWGPIIHDRECRPHWDVSPKASGLTFTKLSPACSSSLLTAVGVLCSAHTAGSGSTTPRKHSRIADPHQARTSLIQKLRQFQKGSRKSVNYVPRECKLYVRSLSLKRIGHVQTLGNCSLIQKPSVPFAHSFRQVC